MLDKAKIALVFDDGHLSVYQNGYPEMQSRGIVGNFALNSQTIADGVATRISVAQGLEMQSAGWGMLNHTKNHRTNFADLDDETTVSEYTECRDWMLLNGFTDGAEFVVFPSNSYDDNSVTLLKSEGCKYSSGISQKVLSFFGHPYGEKYNESRLSMSGQDYTYFASVIDSIIANKTYIHLYYHYVGTAPEGEEVALWNETADFVSQMTYLKTKMDAGLIDAVNLIDYQKEYTFNSRLKFTG